MEADDSSESRFDRICKIVVGCQFGIHDISRTEPDSHSGLPRFNMPLELGLFLGAKRFGQTDQRRKKCIVFDREPYRYQKFISDIAGQDIHHHDAEPGLLIQKLAAWLRDEAADPNVPGGKIIARQYTAFLIDIPVMCGTKHLDPAELTFQDFCKLSTEWIFHTSTDRV